MKLKSGVIVGILLAAALGVSGCEKKPRMTHHFKAHAEKVYHFRNGDYAYQDTSGVWWWYFLMADNGGTRAVNFGSTANPILGGAVQGSAPSSAQLGEAVVQTAEVAFAESGAVLTPAEADAIQQEANNLGVEPADVAEAAGEDSGTSASSPSDSGPGGDSSSSSGGDGGSSGGAGDGGGGGGSPE